MKLTNEFQTIAEDFKRVFDSMASMSSLTLSEADIGKTVHIVVDMVNGFVKQGALSSKEVLSINDDIAEFSAKCENAGITNYVTVTLKGAPNLIPTLFIVLGEIPRASLRTSLKMPRLSKYSPSCPSTAGWRRTSKAK